MQARVFPKQGNGNYLDPKTIVSRIATSMPVVKIDWVRGDQLVADKLNVLISQNAPNVILSSHKSLFGQSVHVELSFPEFPNQYAYFVVQPYGRINIESTDPDNVALVRHVAERLASILEYNFDLCT